MANGMTFERTMTPEEEAHGPDREAGKPAITGLPERPIADRVWAVLDSFEWRSTWEIAEMVGTGYGNVYSALTKSLKDHVESSLSHANGMNAIRVWRRRAL